MLTRLAPVVASVLLLGSTPIPIDSKDWRPIGLQARMIWINIPRGLMFLMKSGFERADFDIRRANGERVMSIVDVPGMDPDVAEMSSATRYCSNGIFGVTKLQRGVRKVLLRLPPEGQQLQFYFEFNERDATAQRIMKTFRIPALKRRCPTNYAAVPPAKGVSVSSRGIWRRIILRKTATPDVAVPAISSASGQLTVNALEDF